MTKPIVTERCPECGNEPLEVIGNISKSFCGTFDREGNLKTETDSEEITYLECAHCYRNLPLSLIKNWD